MERCPWCEGFELYREYHDNEWAVPLFEDNALFELLILEGAQAGLSWATILKKRAHYRQVFNGFKPELIAQYDNRKVASLLADPGIIRNRAKLAATIQNHWSALSEVPAKTTQSDAMSKALSLAGFKFVGSTICYAFMEASGMVNDHLVSCPRFAEVKALSEPRLESR